jgi:hypothetical protein
MNKDLKHDFLIFILNRGSSVVPYGGPENYNL